MVKPCLSDAVLQVETLEQFFLQISLLCLHLSTRSILQIHPKMEKKMFIELLNGLPGRNFKFWYI